MKTQINRAVLTILGLGCLALGASAYAGDGGKRQHSAETPAHNQRHARKTNRAVEKIQQEKNQRIVINPNDVKHLQGDGSEEAVLRAEARRQVREERAERRLQRRIADQKAKAVSGSGNAADPIHYDPSQKPDSVGPVGP